MKTRVYVCHRYNTDKLAKKIEEIVLTFDEVVSVIRTSDFTNAGPSELGGDWADYLILYK